MRIRHLLTLIALTLLSTSAFAVDPYAKPDNSWISISGTVAAPKSDRFMLDYGDGVITVEMDDWDAYGDAYGLMEGDHVTVYGRVDDDLYENASIEAGSVYVEDLNTYYYASSDDEEDAVVWSVSTPVVLNRAIVRGTVTSVAPVVGQFTIDTDKQQLTVDTSEMSYNPLDDIGYQQIDVGDRVSVSCTIDHNFFDQRELVASTLVTLNDNDAMK